MKFSIGDRVRAINDGGGFYAVGDTGVVVEADGMDLRVQWDASPTVESTKGRMWWAGPSDIEIADEEGK